MGRFRQAVGELAKGARRFTRELALGPEVGEIQRASEAITSHVSLLGSREGLEEIRHEPRGERKSIRLVFSQLGSAERLVDFLKSKPDVLRYLNLGKVSEAKGEHVVLTPANWRGEHFIARLKDGLESHPKWMVLKKARK